jgi:hypothetical protein
MTPDQLNIYWTRNFPECPPVGFLLKHIYKGRCARFRTFTDGRKHPAGDADYAQVCTRQNTLLDHLFASEPRIVLITTIPSENEVPPKDAPVFLNFDPHGRFFQSLGMHEFELEFKTPSYWHLFMSAPELRPGRFDSVLRAAAEDPTASGVVNVVFLGPSSRRLLYVYPGGADAVMESELKRGQIQSRYAEWPA